MIRGVRLLLAGVLTILGTVGALCLTPAQAAGQPPAPADAPTPRTTLDRYCVPCHNEKVKTAGLLLDRADLSDVAAGAAVWERVVRKLRAGAMPPAGRPRPDAHATAELVTWLETALDTAAADRPNPGRGPAFHRLNRTEYQNAVRDLLDLDLDVTTLLPADDASYGFDNIAGVLGLSPTLLERYLSAARRISQVAVGSPALLPSMDTYRVPSDMRQEDRDEHLPFGTRGGLLVRYQFTRDAEYTFRIELARNFLDMTSASEPHQIELAIDGVRVQLFTVGEERSGGSRRARPVSSLDPALEVRLPVKAGPRTVSVAFLKKNSAQTETLRLPFMRPAVERGDTGGQPYLGGVTISGPFAAQGAGDTPSRRRIFRCHPDGKNEQSRCATRIISTLARLGYRRPVSDAEVATLVGFYREGYADGGFEGGIELALRRLLVSPAFLFRVERDPVGAPANAPYRLGDLDLASRLSFFLWSSIPDEELLDVAEHGRLRDPAVLDHQVTRMLADARSSALVANFAGQWLYLRNLSSVVPDRRLFPNFDESLRRAFQRETELFFESILREQRSVLDLLRADYTFLNERLARHYGIPSVYGSHFRRVTLEDETRRGLLGQGSILTVTSYPNRTSPVLRGKWIMENILGAAPPPPPPNVPDLKDTNLQGRVLSMRDRMVQHRANPSCASCHSQMDPLGLPMENFDAVGGWRRMGESNEPIDASGTLLNGNTFDGPDGLRRALLSQPEEFVTTVTEKLLTYALGRGLTYADRPAVRTVVRDAAGTEYALSSLVLGVVRSRAFQMRMTARE